MPKLTASKKGNALRVTGEDVEHLSMPGIGDIQYAVKFERKSRRPVLWLWQAFGLTRIDEDQMESLIRAWERAKRRRN